MQKTVGNNKRIAKNTLMLYIRMGLIMLMTLYLSRVILTTLGIEDYGIYNVIAGFVLMFSFLTSTISSGTSRFFAYEIGAGNEEKLSQYFKLSLLSFGILSVIILILAETVGLWFIKNLLVIPADRVSAAILVYHFSISGFIVSMFSIPYKSLIIAYEKMNFYAYMGIVEVVLNLLVVFVLTKLPADKLELYAILLFALNALTSFCYYLYCRINYSTSRYSFFWEKSMFKEFFSYSFWIIIGSLSVLLRGQGVNILLNLFFGPTINAARGIAYQVQSAINQFVSNFYMACRPQITKLYAAGEKEKMMQLIFSSSRICYLLTLIFTLPIYLEAPTILKLWLNTVPAYTVVFTRLTLISIIIDTISYPFQAAVSATGKVKWYQLITGGIIVSALPLSYFTLKQGYSPEAVFYITIITVFTAQISRLFFMKFLLNMSIISFMRNVVSRMVFTSFISAIIPTMIYYNMQPGIYRMSCIISTSLISVVTLGFIIGIPPNERNAIITRIKNAHHYKLSK